MKRAIIAFVLSIGVHMVLCSGIYFWIEYSPERDHGSITLELSGVELSFAEEEEETAEASPLSTPSSVSERSENQIAKVEEKVPDMVSEIDHSQPIIEEKIFSVFDRRVERIEEVVIEQKKAFAAETLTSLPKAPRQARIDKPPRPYRNIKPDYPKNSRLRGEEGKVTLEITVNSKGEVVKVKIVKSSGYTELDESAARAAKKAKFTPASSDGKSVESVAQLTLEFKLKG